MCVTSVGVPDLDEEAGCSRQEKAVVTNITMAQNIAIKNTYTDSSFSGYVERLINFI